MYLLVTTNTGLLVVDTFLGRVVRVSMDVSPTPTIKDKRFGITWDSNFVYVARNNEIIALNKQLRYVTTVMDDLTPGVHQISCDQHGLLWIVSSSTDAILAQDLNTGDRMTFFPHTGEVHKGFVDGGHKHHYNSILIDPPAIYIAAHNLDEPSSLVRCTYPSPFMDVTDTWRKMGRHIHNIAKLDALYTLDSFGSRHIVSTIPHHSISTGALQGDYARGMACCGRYFYVGLFPCNPGNRAERMTCRSRIAVINRNGFVEKFIDLGHTGDINDIRLTTLFDFCHMVQPLHTHEEANKFFRQLHL